MRARKLLCLLLFLAVSAAVWSQNNLGTLAGQVLDTKGKPVAGARVFLQTADGRDPKTELTGHDGKFYFVRLRRGPYHVRAQHEGLWSEWMKNVAVETGKQTTVKLNLKKEEPPKKAKLKTPPKT